MAKTELAKQKVRIAAAHPGRPGEHCKAPAGSFAPLIDRNRCEGKDSCVDVCPYNVFVVDTITDEDWGDLTFIGKLKSWTHGKRTAYTPHADACQACGLCVVACPEDAIRLVPMAASVAPG